jgi:hypothetical protein
MPISLPRAEIQSQRTEAKDREPAYVFLFSSLFLSVMVPPVLLLLASAVCFGNEKLSLKPIAAVFEAAGKVELCLDWGKCGDAKAP